MPLRYASNALAKLRREAPERTAEIDALAAHCAKLEADQDENPRAVIGGNNPPEETPEAVGVPKWDAVKIHMDDLLTEAANWADGVEIINQDQADTVGKLKQDLTDAANLADTARVAEKKPLDDQITEIQDRSRPRCWVTTTAQPAPATCPIPMRPASTPRSARPASPCASPWRRCPIATSATASSISATSHRSGRMTLDLLTGLSAEHHAKPSRLPESGSGWTIRAATSRLSSWRWLNEFAPTGWRGRMSPDSCRMTEDGRWEPSSGSWANAGMGSPGECLTLNISEWTGCRGPCPSDGSVSSLSDVLETQPVPLRYYLSPKACAGILRRAAKRGKALPQLLARALKAVADSGQTSTATED